MKSLEDLRAEAYKELYLLKDKKGRLGREDTEAFWTAVRALYESGTDARSDVLGLYRSLSELDLSPRDRLETCRFLGQDLMFAGNYEGAAAYYDQARKEFESVDEADREELAGSMANILYLRGMMLQSTGQFLLLEENDRRLRQDPLLRKSMEPETVLSILERTGDALFQRQDFEESENCFSEALELLQEGKSAEAKRNHTIRISVKKTNAGCSARKAEPAELVRQLEELAARFEKMDYRDFDLVLKELVVLHEKMGDQEKRLARLRQLGEWYITELERLNHAREPVEPIRARLFDAFGVLIRMLIEQKKEPEAVKALRQCLEAATPPSYWLSLFPEELVREALKELPDAAGGGVKH